jgi:metal-sulfur cluster biosynthetic enzyme
MNKEQILEILKQVYDPEIGINIVDLGLVYQVEILPESINIQITMTSPACPLHGVITRNMDKALRVRFPELGEINIDLVWDPPWSPDLMSEIAKKQLGWTKG